MENELYHHGILGMRWGHRKDRIKNYLVRRKKQNQQTQKKQEVKTKLTKVQKKKQILESRSAKELYKNADLFTTRELREAYDRLNLEKNINGLSPKEVSKGQQFVVKTIKYGKQASELITTGTKVYDSIATVYNLTSPDKPLPTLQSTKQQKKKDGD